MSTSIDAAHSNPMSTSIDVAHSNPKPQPWPDGFKVASGDWSTVNLGAPTDTNMVTLDSPLVLVQDSQDNLSLTITEAGDYIITVAGPNPNTPTITVSKKP